MLKSTVRDNYVLSLRHWCKGRGYTITPSKLHVLGRVSVSKYDRRHFMSTLSLPTSVPGWCLSLNVLDRAFGRTQFLNCVSLVLGGLASTKPSDVNTQTVAVLPSTASSFPQPRSHAVMPFFTQPHPLTTKDEINVPIALSAFRDNPLTSSHTFLYPARPSYIQPRPFPSSHAL